MTTDTSPTQFPLRLLFIRLLVTCLLLPNAAYGDTGLENLFLRKGGANSEEAEDRVYGPKVPQVAAIDATTTGKEHLVLLMKFKDHTERLLPSQREHELLWDIYISGWMERLSYGAFAPTFDVVDCLEINWSESEAAFGTYGRVSGSFSQSKTF